MLAHLNLCNFALLVHRNILYNFCLFHNCHTSIYFYSYFLNDYVYERKLIKQYIGQYYRVNLYLFKNQRLFLYRSTRKNAVDWD